jgi:hypothetical protein
MQAAGNRLPAFFWRGMKTLSYSLTMSNLLETTRCEIDHEFEQ